PPPSPPPPPPPPADVTPPTVVSSTPPTGSMNVSVTSPVRVTFSEDMNPATITSSTFTLTVGGAPVSGSVSFDGTRTATFVPAAGILAEGQSYVGTVNTGVTDVAGNPMASSFIFTFSTADNTAPSITARSPSPGASNVATNTIVQVTFSEPMNSSTINGGTFTLSAGGAPVAASVAYNSDTRVATLSPSAPLSAGQTYTVTLTTGIKDVSGNGLAASDVFSFTTTPGTADVNIGGLSRPGDGGWSGTTGTDNVHIHIVFAQNGQTLSRGPECDQVAEFCYTLPQNAAGAAEVGPNSPGKTFVLITAVTGTVNGSSVTFTLTNTNNRTFTFVGTASGPYSMSGTISGPTMAATSLTLTRPAP
ncbi:MAG TPA: Ig-like domain-containing protein, partial [Gemmatimonadaceae bacterium]|nr:Ig-like domain-containing protein [Gemmatimonadaceae bacterium]